MLSYRHAFHAGNHADVLKHLLLVRMMRYLAQKDKPFWYIDTHAGAGGYELDTGYATKLAEYKSGVGRLWESRQCPAPVADYVDLVRRLNFGGPLRNYPGSPLFALWTVREQDRLRLFELHSKDARLLRENFQSSFRQVVVENVDGFAGLKSLLPPPTRRALVLIDPSYEEKQDYDRVIVSLKDSLVRFPAGVYAVWYPQLARLEPQNLLRRLKRLPVKAWLHVALRVREPAGDGLGMHGSGMFILNPPWTLHDTLADVMPFLVGRLGEDAGAGFTLEQQAA